MRPERTLVGLCAVAAAWAGTLSTGAQANVFPDPSFERDGVPGVARTGQRAGYLRVGAKAHWQGLRGELAVEPFATYRATGYVKANVKSGGMMALYCYGWNSFDWHWDSNAPLKTTDQWQQVETTFVASAGKVSFHPLAFIDAENSEAWIDDVVVERVKSPAETMAALLGKDDPSAADVQLLARYFLHQGERERARDLWDQSDAYTRADLACLLGLSAADPAERGKWTVEMVRNGGLTYRNGEQRFAELTEGRQPQELLAAMAAAVERQPDSVSMAKSYRAMAERCLKTTDPLDTAAETRARLNAVAASLSHAREAVPSGTDARKELEQTMTAFDKARGDLAQREASLAHCRIVLNGTPVSAATHAIVIPADPTPQEEHAARDLRHHLELLTSEVLPIRHDSEVGAATPIVVGRSALLGKLGVTIDYDALGLEGLAIRTAGPALALTGNRRGVLYAVYTFLEDYLGCRWFAPDCTQLPKAGTFRLGEINRTYVPPLEYRATDYPNSRPADWAVRNKLNGTQTDLDEARGGKISYSHFVHTFNALIPPEQYFGEHPEYFSEINGKRVKDYTQLCLTNPQVLQLAIERVRQWIKEAPDATIFSVSQNDWANYCQCRSCTALAEHEGSQAGPLIEFVNALADAIKDEHPSVVIDTLAYQYTRKPPKYTRPRPNVCVRLCSIECCFAHPLESDPFNATFVDDIRAWAKICNRLYVWDYVINYAHCVMPFPNLRVLKPNIGFFIRNSVKGIYEEANYFSKGGELAELRTYLMAKTLWDPTYDTDKAINEFLAGYYGPAAKPLRRYIDLVHGPTEKNRDLHLRIYSPPDAGRLPPELLAEAVKLFDDAERLTQEDPVTLHRVQVARLPLIYAQVMLAQGAYRVDGDQLVVSTPGRESIPALVDRFEQIAREGGVTRVSESAQGTVDNWLAVSRRGFQNLPIVWLRNDSLELGILPDLGGRLWRMRYLKGHVDGARYVPGSVDLLKLYGRLDAPNPADGGYEEYSESGYRSPGWTETYQVTSQDEHGLTLKAKLSNGLELTRTFALEGDAPVVQITSTLANAGDAKRKACLRVHPAFFVDSIRQASARMRDADGAWRSLSLTVPEDLLGEHEKWFRAADRPAGAWAVANEAKGLTVVNRFDPEQVALCYLNWNGADHRVNLELWSNEVELAPGATLTVRHGYEVKTTR
jgi:hypothetical protein